jgi:hypothetical protein
MLRASRAWLIKEVDSPMLGWEVYARKDMLGKETGIALVAGASKSSGQDEAAAAEAPSAGVMLGYALDAFLTNVNNVSTAVSDFIDSYGNNKKEMAKVLAALPREHAATWREGFEATVVAIKANEAINSNKRIKFEKEWFELG